MVFVGNVLYLEFYYHTGEVTYQSPLTPAELLAALHNLDDKVDMKTTIKGK